MRKLIIEQDGNKFIANVNAKGYGQMESVASAWEQARDLLPPDAGGIVKFYQEEFEFFGDKYHAVWNAKKLCWVLVFKDGDVVYSNHGAKYEKELDNEKLCELEQFMESIDFLMEYHG